MLFTNLVTLAVCASAALAFPFRRYDNSSEPTSTITVDQYVTVTLPSTTLVLPASATAQLSSALEDVTQFSTVTKYVTIYSSTLSNGTPVLAPTTVASTYVAENADGVNAEAAVVSPVASGAATDIDTATGCTPETVTVTVTATPTTDGDVYLRSTLYVTSTLTTAIPVTAEFTYSDLTTTITSIVAVTSVQTFSTETIYSTITKTSSIGSVSDIALPTATPGASASAASNGTVPTFTASYSNSTAPLKRRSGGRFSNLIF